MLSISISNSYSQKLVTPSMHVIGAGDTIIVPGKLSTWKFRIAITLTFHISTERSILLSSKFANAVIENHEGGKFFFLLISSICALKTFLN